MITVGMITEYLNDRFPPQRKESWDRVGLNCGHLGAPVTKVLVALDPFADVCREAKLWGAEMIVTHHTLLWDTGFVTDETEQGRNTLFLIENGIACYNAHTNLDLAPDGVSDALARVLDLSRIQIIAPRGTDEAGRPWGLLRSGFVPEQPLYDFLSHVKARLGCPGLRYVSGGKPARKIAVGGGACADEMEIAVKAGCDTLVTGDVKYNDFWDAKALGLSLIDAGHFYTENPVCTVLADTLKCQFPALEVRISERHRDCAMFFE